MTERWTHNGQPVGQPQRPWRLTRAQRVEMEAALGALRVRCDGEALVLALESCGIGGWVWLRRVCLDGDVYIDSMLARRRAIRARVAIALRAALRADEDARREEVHRMDIYGDWPTIAIDAMREWPPARRNDFNLVPLALWEVEERRRRETVRVVEALLVWGLS